MPGFRPLQDRVLLKRVEAEETTAGGIIIPDTAKEKPAEGEVLAVGPGARDDAGALHLCPWHPQCRRSDRSGPGAPFRQTGTADAGKRR